MADAPPRIITVLDFRRRRMAVRWNIDAHAGTSHEEATARAHGVALIRPAQPSVCVYAQGGELHLQIGERLIYLRLNEPRVLTEPKLISAGLRREFRVEDGAGATLYRERYWTGKGPDFFRTLAEHCARPQWRSDSARTWSDGVDPGELRQSWAG
ncbi:MAG: hypothetical protein JSS24_03200 [Proteobacteria bacterium]|nr:hypothetical protein [Pseudomonadota bacterium]